MFQFVRSKGPAHWRAYLVDERNTLHREQLQKLLRDQYERIATIDGCDVYERRSQRQASAY